MKIMKKIREFWATLVEDTTISKRELFFILATCSLAGIVLGTFFSPKKTVNIGSNNSGNGCNYLEDEEEE